TDLCHKTSPVRAGRRTRQKERRRAENGGLLHHRKDGKNPDQKLVDDHAEGERAGGGGRGDYLALPLLRG
ncbi:hypothetical protein, partial [Xanthomonas oryzae]|uniref:hypothetical protein n=1 Tax=Xanthomonas oryzae TaxID=347 RepID=UPI001C4CBF82